LVFVGDVLEIVKGTSLQVAMENHGESIYNIIPPKAIVMEKPPMHKSIHSGTKPPTASTFHNKTTTYPAVSNLGGDAAQKVVPDSTHHGLGKKNGSYRNDATHYMKGQDKTGKVQTLAEVKRTHPESLKPTHLAPSIQPAVPRAHDAAPVMNLVTSKNFVVANAVETILACPKKTTTTAKDYVRKEDYGKVPKYLNQIKSDIDAEYRYINELQDQYNEINGPKVSPMSEEERQTLIDGLKAKWEAINTEYQGNTHITKLDTVGKKRSKEKLEAELSQIEKDIEKLNRRNIMVDHCY